MNSLKISLNTYQEILSDFQKHDNSIKSDPNRRRGQALFDIVSNHAPNIATNIAGDRKLDPFNDDENIEACMIYLANLIEQ